MTLTAGYTFTSGRGVCDLIAHHLISILPIKNPVTYEMHFSATWISDRRLFDPEHKDIDCPKCLRQRVYFDREIGCYCMFCGYVLSAEETLLQMEKLAATSPPAIGSDKKGTTPIIEIKGPRSRRTKTDQVKQIPGPQDDKKSE